MHTYLCNTVPIFMILPRTYHQPWLPHLLRYYKARIAQGPSSSPNICLGRDSRAGAPTPPWQPGAFCLLPCPGARSFPRLGTSYPSPPRVGAGEPRASQRPARPCLRAGRPHPAPPRLPGAAGPWRSRHLVPAAACALLRHGGHGRGAGAAGGRRLVAAAAGGPGARW